MSPASYTNTDYNKTTHKTAQECWDADKFRRDLLIKNGYRTLFIWESDVNSGTFKEIITRSIFDF